MFAKKDLLGFNGNQNQNLFIIYSRLLVNLFIEKQ